MKGTKMTAVRRPRRARRLALAASLALCLTSAAAFADNANALEQQLTAADGAATDGLGTSVALAGDIAVVGAPFAGNGDQGAVYVFKRVGDRWQQTARLTASDGAAGDRLGSSVALAGDTIVAGALGDDLNRGSVYTFALTGAATRTETARLTATDGEPFDQLGFSVALAGDTIVAGAPLDNVGANGLQGSLYTFAATGAATRTETAKLTAGDGAAGDELGFSLALAGETIVAGAPFDTVGANADQGSVYTFPAAGAAARTEAAKLTAGDGAANDLLGFSVALAGDTIVAGAPFDKVGANAEQGSVYTFAATGAATRTETAKLTTTDGAADDRLAESVAVAGDTIVAGAPDDDAGANADQGSAYTFAATGAAARTETAKLASSDGAADDLFGWSVAVAGDTIVAGAPLDDVGANADQGSASVVFAPAPTTPAGPPPPGPPPPAGPAPGPPAAPAPVSPLPSPAPAAGRAIGRLRLGARCVRPTRSGRVRIGISMLLARPGPIEIRIDRALGPKPRHSCPRRDPTRRFTGSFRHLTSLTRNPTGPVAAAAVGRSITLKPRLKPGLYRITVRAQLPGGRLSRPLYRYLRVLARST
jgi:hypothetical protein